MCSINVLAQQDISKLFDEKGSIVPQQESGIYYTLREINIEITKKGYFTKTTHNKMKIISKNGIDKCSNIQVPYNSNIEELEVKLARTIKPSGKSIKAREIRDAEPVQNIPSYSGLKVKKICMPNVEIGDTIEYKTVLELKYPPLSGEYNVDLSFAESDPIKTSRIILVVPEKLNIKTQVHNATVEPDIALSKKGKNKIYTWILNDVPRIEPEASCPPFDRFLPWVRITTVESWNAIAEWYGTLIKKSISINPKMRIKTLDIVKDSKTELEKAKHIFNYVQSSIRYVQLESGHDIFNPHSSVDVFKNKYGDCKDKVTLLLAMYKVVGIEALPALVSSGYRSFASDLPSYEQFDHLVILYRLEDDAFWLEPTNETVPFGSMLSVYQGRKALVISKNKKGEFIPISIAPPEENISTTKIRLSLDEDGNAKGSIEINITGQSAIGLRQILKYISKADRDQFLKAVSKSLVFNMNEVVDYRLYKLEENDEPLKMTFDFIATDWATTTGDYMMFNLFAPSLSRGLDLMFSDSNRSYPIHFIEKSIEEDYVEVDLPPGFKVEEIPSSKHLKTLFGSFDILHGITGNRVTGELRVVRDVLDIPAEDFETLKKSYDEISKEHGKKVVLKKSAVNKIFKSIR